MKWQDELRQLKLDYLKQTAPGFFELSGGYRMKLKSYSDQTTNGLTNAVYDWLKYSGHYVNRINSQGQMRKIKGKLQYTHGTSNLGTPDLDAIINGKPVKIEIKCRQTGDRLRKEQIQEKDRIEASGGIYIVIGDMNQFVSFYKGFAVNIVNETNTVNALNSINKR